MASTSLGLKIFELRKVKKLTQTALGRLLGISGVAVSQFEKGVNKPSYETVVKMSEALGFDFNPLYIESYATRGLAHSKLPAGWEDSEHLEQRLKEVGMTDPYLNPYVTLPVLSIANFIKYCLLKNPFPLSELSFPNKVGIAAHNLPSLSSKGVSYDNSVILEIQGNIMAPRYPHGSWQVVQLVEKTHWQYATGVHAIWLKTQKLLVRRIVSNKDGVLTVATDAVLESNNIKLEEIESLWKMGQAAHMPPEH